MVEIVGMIDYNRINLKFCISSENLRKQTILFENGENKKEYLFCDEQEEGLYEISDYRCQRRGDVGC